MTNLHPVMAQALKPYAPPTAAQTAVTVAKMFGEPPCPKGCIEWVHEKLLSGCNVVCHFEADEGEPQTRDDPGYPPSLMLVAAYVRDVDILELLHPDQIEQIERDAMEALDSREEDRRAEALYAAEISRNESLEY